MVTFKQKGNFKKTETFLKKITHKDLYSRLDEFGQMGVDALAEATPKRTGLTAASWYYTIEKTKDSVAIYWNNSNIQNGVNIAVMLEYGHGTGNGGYVVGRNYITPAIQPIFDKIADEIWKGVTDA
jgi:hypothetical protein